VTRGSRPAVTRDHSTYAVHAFFEIVTTDSRLFNLPAFYRLPPWFKYLNKTGGSSFRLFTKTMITVWVLGLMPACFCLF